MATAAATVTLENILEIQSDLVRQGEYNERSGLGGYRHLGQMMEMRHEIAKDANQPDQEVSRKIGLVMDWRHFHNGPAIGLTKDRSQILILGKVPPLPEVVDPTYKPSQMVKTAYGMISAAALPPEELESRGIKLEKTPMMKQRFVDHMSGTFGKFMLCRPLTQILFKIDGQIGMTTIDFQSDPYDGTSATFFLDTATGEGHIYGGKFQIARM